MRPRHAGHLPQSLSAGEPERSERAAVGERGELVLAQAGAAREVLGGREAGDRLLALDRLARFLTEGLHEAQAEAQSAVGVRHAWWRSARDWSAHS